MRPCTLLKVTRQGWDLNLHHLIQSLLPTVVFQLASATLYQSRSASFEFYIQVTKCKFIVNLNSLQKGNHFADHLHQSIFQPHVDYPLRITFKRPPSGTLGADRPEFNSFAQCFYAG